MVVPVPDQLEYISDANGATKDFPYPKRFLQKDEVVVLLRDADGVDTPQILNTHYTIAGSSWPTGGTVSFVTAPQAPNKVVRYRMTQAKQTVVLNNLSRNDAPSVELQLDRLTMAIQDRGNFLTRIRDWLSSTAIALRVERAERIAGDANLNERVDQEIVDRDNGDKAVASLIGQAGPIETARFDTMLAASLAVIKPTIQSVTVGGRNVAGDCEATEFVQVPSAVTTHTAAFTSANGLHFEARGSELDFAIFGGVDDGVTDNSDAWYAQRAYRISRFPDTVVSVRKRSIGIILVNSGFWIDGEPYSADGEITLQGPGVAQRQNLNLLSGKFRFLNTTNLAENIAPSFVDDKFKNLLSAGELDYSEEKHIAMSACRPFQHTSGTDTVASDTTGYSISTRFVQFDAAVASVAYGGKWFGMLTPVKAGKSYSMGIRPAPDTAWISAGVCIVTTSGIHEIYGRQSDSIVTHAYKPKGSALATKIYPSIENLGGYYTRDQLGYRFPWANISVDVIKPDTFVVCINGIAVTPPIVDPGFILEVGPVLFPRSTTATSTDTPTIVGITERSNFLPASQRGRSVVYVGSSSTDPGVRSWPEHFELEIEQSFGVQIVRSLNIAKAGHTIAAQLAALQAGDFGPAPFRYTDIIAFIGANDIQVQTGRVAFQQSVADMIDFADSKNCNIIFILPQGYYNQADAEANGGLGGETKNAEFHALYREYISIVAAAKRATGSRVSTLDVDRIIGPVLAAYLSFPDKKMDRIVADNIHITPEVRRNIGRAAARKLMGMLSPKPSVNSDKWVNSNITLQNGWTGTLALRVDNDEVQTVGQLTAGTVADGTAVLTLPFGIRPAQSYRIRVQAGGASTAYLFVQTNGIVAIYGATGVTNIDMSQLKFRRA